MLALNSIQSFQRNIKPIYYSQISYFHKLYILQNFRWTNISEISQNLITGLVRIKKVKSKFCRYFFFIISYNIYQTPYMIILRKHTLPERISKIKQVSHSLDKTHPRIRSQNFHIQKLDSSPQNPAKNQLIKITEKCESSPFSTPKSNQSISDDVEKLITKNKLTINLTGQVTPSLSQLPCISSFKKMKNMLVQSPLYHKYSELRLKKGETQSLLARLEREYDMAAAKIKINRHSKRLVRNSRFESKQSKTMFEPKPTAHHQPLKQRLSCINIAKTHYTFPQKIRVPTNKQTEFSSKDGWRLKDFFCHIQNQWEGDDNRVKRLKQREEILNKLKKINEECQVLENNRNQIIKSIDVFAKYNENLSQNLSKKHKKINKVYYSENY